MIGNLALYVALKLLSWLLPVIPLRLAYALASAAGYCAFYLFPIPRDAIRANLAQVTGRDPGDRRVGALAREAFRNDAKNWVDTIRIGHLSSETILCSVDVFGWEHLENALAQGHGVVLVTLHLGNFDLVGQVLTARGFQVTVPVERMRPERLFRFLMAERQSKGINAVPVDHAAREMLLALRDGQIVALAGDRNIAGRGIEVDFFGRPANLPRGAISLARHTGAPVVMGVGIRTASNRYQGFVTPPLDLTFGGDTEQDLRANGQRLARVMEEFITQYPGQWLVFSPIWAPGGPPPPSPAVETRQEAAV